MGEIKYVAVSIDFNNHIYGWISNVSPILWTAEFGDAKRFNDMDTIRSFLNDELEVLKGTLKCSKDIKAILICKLKNNRSIMSTEIFLHK